MTEQQAFGIYCHAIVGFLGGALIAWEFGKKDFIRVGLEGPKNKRILFAMASFAVCKLDGLVDPCLDAGGICCLSSSRA